MAYNPNYSNSNRSNSGRNDYNRSSPQIAPKINAMPLPANYIDIAEEVIRSLCEEGKKQISTSKIRNLLSIVSDIYNAENLRSDETLSESGITGISMFRIRAVYEAGREDTVKRFIEKAKILEYAKDIGSSRAKLINFAHYMEALVAYHRYYVGGKD